MKVVRVADPLFFQFWSALVEADGLFIPLYADRNLAYYRTYFGHEFSDLSYVIAGEDGPLQGLRVTSHQDSDGYLNLSCYGLPSLFLARPSLAARRRRDVGKLLRETFAEIMQSHRVRTTHRDFLRFGAISDFSRHLLGLGGKAAPQFTQMLDLSQNEEQLHSELSKSFRWNVNWGAKNLTLLVVEGDNVTADRMEGFRKLHVEAAGRETRSLESWDAQLEMLKVGEAFAVFADMNGDMVSAALFPVSKAYCFYGVSASRRELFDKPISHVVLWEAVRHARNLGCRWFETGEQLFPAQGQSAATEKELGISAFKRGFGGQTQVRLTISLEVGGA